MKEPDERGEETRPTEDRMSRLSEAILRINEHLDFDGVLQEVVDSARTLIGARYGGMAVVDESGDLQSFMMSGFDPAEQERILNVPESRELFKHFIRLSEPIRISDFHGHIRSLGFPDMRLPLRVDERFSFLAAPMLYRGVSSGNIYLAQKESGKELQREDEETLAMFAAQAALVIANARKYRDEQRARSELETLINTSPVGVVVFDAKTGAPVSFNREAVRIMQNVLLPDRDPEQLLKVLHVRRGDGREFSLADLPIAKLLKEGEIVRAEEMILSVPEGSSVSVLVNVTPLHSESGVTESSVVTIQDMSSLEELEKLRAEFLAMVSHELRAPLTSIKRSSDTLLESFGSLDPAEAVQFVRIIKSQAERMQDLIGELLDVARIETGTLSVMPEPAEVASLVDEARNTFQSGGGRDNIVIDLETDLPRVMADRRRIAQVLGNLLTNAASYSQESSPIQVTASLEGNHVAIEVTDEGRGVAPERLPLLFMKFSRVEDEGERRTADTGLGLAICKGIVEAHGGRIWAESGGLGLGTKFTFTLPVADEMRSSPSKEEPHSSVASRIATRGWTRILVVDDDPMTLRYVRDALTGAGFVPLVTADPDEALRLAVAERPQLALLDLLLPGKDGIELMGLILDSVDVPVIFLSAYGRDEIVARAIDAGAVDYMVKPFSPTELVARVRGALRRQAGPSPGEPHGRFRLGEVIIDYNARRVSVAGAQVQMTPTEFDLLVELSVNAGRVVTYDSLLDRVWGAGHTGGKGRVRTYVKRLRRKLGDNARAPRYIFAEHRVGYRMAKPKTSKSN